MIASSDLDGMVAIHTTMEDLYRRLWCVHEVFTCTLFLCLTRLPGHQVDKAIASDVKVSAAMSDQYEAELLRRVEFFIKKGFSYKVTPSCHGSSNSLVMESLIR